MTRPEDTVLGIAQDYQDVMSLPDVDRVLAALDEIVAERDRLAAALERVSVELQAMYELAPGEHLNPAREIVREALRPRQEQP